MAQKRIFAAVWTPKRYRVTRYKKGAQHKLQVWKRWYERLGWSVHSAGPDAYIARSPDGEERHAIVLHEYDAATSERIERPLPPPLTDEEVRVKYLDVKPKAEPKAKRGRGKPVWV